MKVHRTQKKMAFHVSLPNKWPHEEEIDEAIKDGDLRSALGFMGLRALRFDFELSGT